MANATSSFSIRYAYRDDVFLFVLLRYLNLSSSSPSWTAACPFQVFLAFGSQVSLKAPTRQKNDPLRRKIMVSLVEYVGISHMSVAFKLEVHGKIIHFGAHLFWFCFRIGGVLRNVATWNQNNTKKLHFKPYSSFSKFRGVPSSCFFR